MTTPHPTDPSAGHGVVHPRRTVAEKVQRRFTWTALWGARRIRQGLRRAGVPLRVLAVGLEAADRLLRRGERLRLVLLDLLADLHASDQGSRLPLALHVVNHILTSETPDLYVDPIATEEVERFARQETRFWKRYLALSRLKRFATTKVFRRRYSFVLPA